MLASRSAPGDPVHTRSDLGVAAQRAGNALDLYSIARELHRSGKCVEASLRRAEAQFLRERRALLAVVDVLVEELKRQGCGLWDGVATLRERLIVARSEEVSTSARTAILAEVSTRVVDAYLIHDEPESVPG